MLSAEALRLSAIEVLSPTGASPSDYPTLAQHRVYDSATIAVEDMAGGPYTPCLSVFTEDVRAERRGQGAPSYSVDVTAVLVVIAELAVAIDDPEGGIAIAPYAEEDAQARLVLAALTAQVRKALLFAPAGSIFRTIAKSVEDLRIEPFSLPNFDLRWMRNTMRFTCAIRDDVYADGPGLPEPLANLREKLPAGSYALGKLAELDALFAATKRDALEEIVFSTKGNPVADPEGSVP